MKINGHTYGEFICMDDVRRELHMSKRRLAYLLQNGYIPCEIRDSATWKYKIRTKDVVVYIKSGISPDIPPGVFKRKPQAEVERIKFNKKKLKELFKERMSEYLICTPKVRRFWRCIFLWVKKEEKTKFIVQNLKFVL